MKITEQEAREKIAQSRLETERRVNQKVQKKREELAALRLEQNNRYDFFTDSATPTAQTNPVSCEPTDLQKYSLQCPLSPMRNTFRDKLCW